MIYVVLTDAGVETRPIVAATLADAADQIKQLHGQGTGQLRVALMLPTVTGTLTQNPTDPLLATIAMTGDSQTQQTIRQNLTTFLAVPAPNQAQVTAAVRALARLATGDFTGST